MSGGKYRIPGYYGLSIYGILFLYTFLRILQSISSHATNRIKYLNYKLGFHVVFASFCLCEGLYSYSLTINDSITSWGYSIHFAALFLGVVSFALIVNLWGYSLNFYQCYWKFSLLSSLLIFVNFIAFILSVIYIVKYNGLDGYRDERTKVYVAVLLIHVLSILVFSVVLLTYGFSISHKLAQSYEQKINFSQSFKEKIYLLFRINVVLSVCCFCYLLRAVLVAIIVYEELNDVTVINFPNLLWFLLSAWIPTVCPVVPRSLLLPSRLSLICLFVCVLQGVFFLYIMKTTSLSKPSRNLSSDVKESKTQLAPMGQGQGQGPWLEQDEEDPMVERYSWYYEEQESSRFEDRPSVASDRVSSLSVVTRMLSMKDSLLYRESTA